MPKAIKKILKYVSMKFPKNSYQRKNKKMDEKVPIPRIELREILSR